MTSESMAALPGRPKNTNRAGHYNPHARKLPPFGKHAVEYLKANGPPANSVWIASGYGFWGNPFTFAKYCNTFQDRIGLVYPDELSPEYYVWPVADCEVLAWMHDVPDSTALELSTALVRDGARSVRIIQQTGCQTSMAVIQRGNSQCCMTR